MGLLIPRIIPIITLLVAEGYTYTRLSKRAINAFAGEHFNLSAYLRYQMCPLLISIYQKNVATTL